MREKIFSDVIDDVLRHAFHDVLTYRVEKDTDGKCDDQQEHQLVELVVVLRGDDDVERFLRDLRGAEGRHRAECGEDQSDGHLHFILADVDPRAL